MSMINITLTMKMVYRRLGYGDRLQPGDVWAKGDPNEEGTVICLVDYSSYGYSCYGIVGHVDYPESTGAWRGSLELVPDPARLDYDMSDRKIELNL